MVVNPKYFGQSTDTVPSQIQDGVDFPHTGLLKALSTAASGRIPLNGFDITSPTTTSIPIDAGTILYDGRVATVIASTLTLSTGHTNGYHLLVVTKPTGDPLTGTLALRTPSATNQVADYVLGDTIIAVITHTGSTPLIQYLTYDKVSNHVSLAYDNGGSGYTEVGTIKAGGVGIDITADDVLDLGALTLTNKNNDRDIVFKTTDSSGTTTTAVTIDTSLSNKIFAAGDVQAAGRTLTQNTINTNTNHAVLTATSNAWEHNAQAALTYNAGGINTLANTGSYTATGGVDTGLAINAGTSLSAATTISAGGEIRANGGIQSNKYFATAYETLDINHGPTQPSGDYSYIFIGDISPNPPHAPTSLLTITLPQASAVVGRLLHFKNLNPTSIVIEADPSGDNIDMTTAGSFTTGSTTLTPAAGGNATYITLAPLQTITLMSVGGEGGLMPPFTQGYYIMSAMS
tara:strand:+ start:1886 stop:3265 length:1380 start_codon:yes stop_codon:yes gene_type:complete